MGTQVQCKSYLPGYHPTSDLNEDANFSWSHFWEDRTRSRQLYNDLKPRGVSRWSEYDKEMLKRTMLQHEAIFQKQVCELHRLYRIQKELMHEFKKNQLNRFSGQMETSKSSMFASQMHPEFDEHLSCQPHPSLVITCRSTANVTDSDDKRASLNFLGNCAMQCNLISTKNGGCVKNDRPADTKLMIFPRRILDLHLPADAYIENEDTERTETENVIEPCAMAAETVNMIHGTEADDVKLTLGSVEVPGFDKGNLKSKLHSRNGLPMRSLADVNEPIKDSCEKRAVGSGTHKFSGLNVHSKELQQPWTAMRAKPSFPHTMPFMDKHSDEVISLNYLDADKVDVGQEQRLLHNDSGQRKMVVNSFDLGLTSIKYPMSSESIKLKFDKAQESHLADQNQTETWFREKTALSIETSRSQDLINSNQPGFTASQVSSLLSVVPPFSYASATSPSSSSWRKPTEIIDHIPVAVQALPCFSVSSMLNGQSESYNAVKQRNNIDGYKLQCNGYLHTQMKLDNKSSSHANGLHHGIKMNSTSLTGTHLLQSNLEKPNLSNNGDTLLYKNSEIHEPRNCSKGLQFVDVKSMKDLNLNQGILCGIQDGLTTQQNLVRKHDEMLKGLIWLREKPCCNGSAEIKERDTQSDSGFNKDYSQLIFTGFLGEEVKDKGSSTSALKHSTSSFDSKESRFQRSVISHNLNGKGIVSLSDNSRRTFKCSNSVSYDGQYLADDAKGCGKGKAVRNCSPSLRNDINLNYDLIPLSDTKLFGMSAEGEKQVPSLLSLPSVAGKVTRNIDLEAPADELEEDNTISGVEVVAISHPKTTAEMSHEKTSSQATSIRLAAYAIVSMSMDVHKVTCYPFVPSLCESLHLLAEVVASSAESKGSRDGSCEASDDDELDAFETMTLKLEELKPDEYCCKPYQQEKTKDEEKSMASLLLTRPRRGQARKRRQRRDFQKDVLPALASLSRHEVTEDLQALGGTTRSGKSRQVNSTRSTGQNRTSFQSRGRKQPRSLVITVAEVHDSTPQLQPIHTKLENDGRNIMTWGRTTRRCSRQRIPTGNDASAPQ